MSDTPDSDGAKFDRWLLPIMVMLACWGMAFSTWLELLTSIDASVVFFAGSFFLSIAHLRLADPKTSRQLFLVVAVAAAVIALTFLLCLGFFVLADSPPIQERGYWAQLSVRALGVGLCFAAALYCSKQIYLRLGVPLRNNSHFNIGSSGNS